MDAIRILIVEDDRDWRRGLASYLNRQPDLAVVAAVDNGAEALAVVRREPVDVVLMDIMLAHRAEGLELTLEVTQTSDAKVLMLSSLTEPEMIFEAFRSGATDYLVKSRFELIPDAVRAAHANASPINPAVAAKLREEFRRLKELEREVISRSLREALTAQECEILKLIGQGMSQSQVAERLYISLRTVKVHVGNILRKLECGSSKEALQKLKDAGVEL